MPLYDYKCTKCGTVSEVRHGFDDTYDQPCSACGATMARVFNPAPIVFKGSGFYVTDSKPSSSSSSNAESKTESKPAATETKSETKPEAKSDSKSESAA